MSSPLLSPDSHAGLEIVQSMGNSLAALAVQEPGTVHYFAAVSVFLAFIVLLLIIRFLLKWILPSIVSKTRSTFDDGMIGAVRSPFTVIHHSSGLICHDSRCELSLRRNVCIY